MVRSYDLRFLFCAVALVSLASCVDLSKSTDKSVANESPSDSSPLVIPGMNFERSGHMASRLADGRVLVVGGLPGNDNTFESAEIYDPSTNTWTLTGSPIVPDRQHGRSVTLHDGRVLIVGGSVGSYPVGPKELEVYDPADGLFHLVGMSANSRDGASVTLLNDGRVLILGGAQFDFTHIQMRFYSDGEIFDPSTNQLHPIFRPMKLARAEHSAAVMPNGDVLVTGGAGYGGELVLAEVFHIGSEGLTETNPMRDARAGHSTYIVGDDMIVIGQSTHTSAAIAIGEFYHSVFSRLPVSSLKTYGSANLQAQDSSINFFGGYDPATQAVNDSIVMFDPATSNMVVRGKLSTPRSFFPVVELLDGSFLAIGGWTPSGDTNSVERVVF